MSTGQTFLNKFSKVSPTGLEWARIEYHLQLSLGSTCATVKNIWSIASGTNSYNFEKNNKVIILQSWHKGNMNQLIQTLFNKSIYDEKNYILDI